MTLLGHGGDQPSDLCFQFGLALARAVIGFLVLNWMATQIPMLDT